MRASSRPGAKEDQAAAFAFERPAGSAVRSRPYSLPTLVASTFVCASGERCPRSRLITLSEFGQVEFGCGKSFDHMRLSSPHHARLRPVTASLKNEAKTCSRM